ncbi:rhodanese-related sulfurtransferase [Aquimarina sp. MAR_2010_214]|uniref:rhodanese-like domain-containing protein n=1 Tax=Aquimarina sp. MAR_2010_214 TaxID=1250026 RepID=UPI000C700583|nr:rhodanese-like domain-containing protein [Aquimarina sp. MAR_2010_214]PKV48147.1 rhodanese-related sulfurtransferase [Aquimarina sp. MAR_2010_214]
MKIFILSISLFFSVITSAQNSLDELLRQYNNESIPYISVSTLETIQDTVLLLDAREKKEYQVSHLKNAVHIGYDHFKIKSFTQQHISKDPYIVVYCSIGIRSEDISEQLKKAGYTNVYNLYGGIFEWKNNDLPILNSNEELTDEIHTYSKKWGKWLHKGKKIYSN